MFIAPFHNIWHFVFVNSVISTMILAQFRIYVEKNLSLQEGFDIPSGLLTVTVFVALYLRCAQMTLSIP